MLFDVEGLQVTDAESGAGGTLEVWAVTDHAAARACPDCGTVSGRVYEQVLTGRGMWPGAWMQCRCAG